MNHWQRGLKDFSPWPTESEVVSSVLWIVPHLKHRSFSSSSAFTAMSVRFTISGEISAYVTDLKKKNPTIEVVTFRLRGWSMLGVFFAVAGIHPSRT